MDGHRLLQASERVDEAAVERQANAADMPSRKLASRRYAAIPLPKTIAEQPRFRQSAQHRAPMARSIRLGLSRMRVRYLHHFDSHRRLGAAGGSAHVGAPLRPHDTASRCDLHHAGRNGGRFRAPPTDLSTNDGCEPAPAPVPGSPRHA
jgi:hypothetical protein